MKIVAAPDKFRGTAGAGEVAAAVARAAGARDARCVQLPMSDGGEGMLEAFGGGNQELVVTGPLGDPVRAAWRLQPDGVAVVESAYANGIALVGGADGNDPEAATTRGVGELVVAAARAGATQIIVGVGGSATTDGGQGALDALEPHSRLRGVELVVACDVETRFVDAAAIFAPQKGASPAQVTLLTRRLERLAQVYEARFGVDVRQLPGSGAAGGLAGGLAALGARLVPGFDLVADAVDLEERVAAADLVVTGEGLLDAQSFAGKVVGGVLAMAADAGVPAAVLAGDVADDADVPAGVTVVSLVERFGAERSFADPAGCIRALATELCRRAAG